MSTHVRVRSKPRKIGPDEWQWDSYIEGPRWAFGVSTIYDFAHGYGLHVDDVREHKGLITKTVTFTVSGPVEDIELMGRAMARAIREWNAD